MAVYMIRVGETGPVKIGYAKSVSRRIASLQCAHAETLVLLRRIDGDSDEEAWLHNHFKSRHLRGEWFEYDPTMLTVKVPAEIEAASARSQMVKERGRGGIVDMIAAKFGTRVDLAIALGCDQSTISHWKNRGGDLIPSRWQQPIIAAARERGIDVRPSDFFPDEAA